MQDTVTGGVDSFGQTSGLGTVRLRRTLAGQAWQAGRVRTTALWGETLQILSAHSAPILFYTVFGLAGASIVGALAGGLVLPIINARLARFATLNGIGESQLLVQSIAGLFLFIFARGAITWIAMHGADQRTPKVGEAFRATLKRWPALLAQSLVYGALISLGVTGITFMLREMRLDATNVGRFTTGIGDMMRIAGARALATVMPDPGSPFSEGLNYLRGAVNRPVATTFLIATYSRDFTFIPYSAAPVLWPIGLGCAIVVVITETLLQLRTVMAMRADGPGSVAGLTDSLRAGIKHFGTITCQVWMVRLVTVLAGALFVIFPLVFVQTFFLPLYARQIGGYWLYSASSMVLAVGSALISALWTTFAIVFDTRLFAAINT